MSMEVLVPPIYTVALRLAPVLLLSHQVRRHSDGVTSRSWLTRQVGRSGCS